ncbi:hypothetical protein CYY_002157 [Polysphondylium violaceum]|uniref:threonine--tRNA ligase n=1 Tax=Polysphondylium violaceum TaxID=133409 RepID=A0A8J4V360_9MYCE|nr:hypothetical protein CYY_002157 [Polysphondylium violaceum]
MFGSLLRHTTASRASRSILGFINNRYYGSNVKLNDGRIMSFDTHLRPLDIANSISKSLAKQSMVSRINNKQLQSMKTVVNQDDYSIEFLNFEDQDARKCFWINSSVILGQAVTQYFAAVRPDVKVTIVNHGSLVDETKADSINQGSFYVDIHFSDSQMTLKEEDIRAIYKIMQTNVKSKDPIENQSMSLQEAQQLFPSSMIQSFANNVPVTNYKGFYSITKAPSVDMSGSFSFELIKNSSVVGQEPFSLLQRIVGISFPDAKQLAQWQEVQKAAALKDHRVIGKNQELFFFHPFSPGSCFFLPHGTRIYNKLLDFLRREYKKRGYEEVITPNIYNQKLWETSGHWNNYEENMFSFNCDDTKYSLKPMNCPGHCLIFAHKNRSYKELPLRIADFGALHRNESHGSLTGLTRVRRFQQDDAHIFCTHDMIKDEIRGCLDFMQFVYRIFNFSFHLELSTRPQKFLGEKAVWDKAEAALGEVLTEFCGDKWKINPEDGAFYGPKIDIHLRDANGKSHQCATIQLDFQLPIRFSLEYQTDSLENPFDRPVMIHRALFGSVERMMAILMEHTAGKWPFWLSPRQCLIIPVTDKFTAEASLIQQSIASKGYHVDIDANNSKTMGKKVREGLIQRYNYILVIGQEEVDTKILNVKRRDSPDSDSKLSLDQLLLEFQENNDKFLPISIDEPAISNSVKILVLNNPREYDPEDSDASDYEYYQDDKEELKEDFNIKCLPQSLTQLNFNDGNSNGSIKYLLFGIESEKLSENFFNIPESPIFFKKKKLQRFNFE